MGILPAPHPDSRKNLVGKTTRIEAESEGGGVR